MGRPLCLAFIMYWYQLATLFRLLVRSGSSRFELFNLQRATFGGGDWWWHGEGAWNCPYMRVRATMASAQKRAPAFGAVRTCVPELFPKKLLLFLDGSEHAEMREVLKAITAEANWRPRVPQLPQILAKLAPQPCTVESLTRAITDRMVATAIWYLLFDVELTPAQADVAAMWGASG